MGSFPTPTPIPQFFSPAIPLEPTALRQGDSWNWKRTFDDYPSALYTLAYVLNSAKNRFQIPTAAITADSENVQFLIQATPEQTQACVPDKYKLIAVLTGNAGSPAAGQQITLVLQDVTVAPNILDATAPVDMCSAARKNLEAIDACLLSNSDPSVQEYMINGRQLRRFSRAELLKEREYWKNEVRAEQRANGEYARPRNIGFRFTPTSS